MNRLVLFSFFDKEGIVDKYVYCLLKELQTIASKIVVIINGYINPFDRERLKAYSVQVIQRENEGYDAGAYKDALINHIGIERVKEYDEVILCNDTFYGPFEPFEKVWRLFEEKDIDFWGLHLWQAGYLNWISSFFVVFRKKILLDDRFYEYWNTYIDSTCKDIKLVYATFEVGLFYELCEMGYRYDVYAQKGDYHIMMSPDYAIQKYGAPFMKKRAFDPRFYNQENVYKALTSISKMEMYDVDIIYESAKRKYDWEINRSILECADDLQSDEYKTLPESRQAKDLSDLKIYCDIWENENIYIYGAGVVAAKIYFLLRKNIKKFGGFVVSKLVDEHILFNYPIIMCDNDELNGKCIIVAMNSKNSDGLREKLKETDKVIHIWNNFEV